ncbi:MAG: hypothetical protein LDL56_09055 [Armatimonadetes bacterium]|nr:hypothetical protein [Armatimonadota bacterium]MCA1997361.1 hypothetical protein [Armatimonadota bacterium]
MRRATDCERFLLGLLLSAIVGWSLTVVALLERNRRLEGELDALSEANRSLASQLQGR